MMRGIRSALISLACATGMLAAALGPAQADTSGERPGAEAKFVQVDPISYTLQKPDGKDILSIPFTTTKAKIFYTYQPADVGSDTAPLFIFLNGGPGAATTANFFANNTAPYTLNLDAVGNDADGVVKNPNSWTKMANLLYIDPAQSGFSYNISDEVFKNLGTEVLGQLFQEYMNRGNINPMIDADQLLRVILAFLKEHPDLQNREVVMVGESYGGVRVSTILHMLMHSGMYDKGGSSFFQDPGLAAKVREQFGTTTAPTPEQVSKQFDRQILVQPQLTSYQGKVQDEMFWDDRWSVIDWIAEDTGHAGAFTRNQAWCYTQMAIFWTKGTCATMAYLPEWNRDRYDYAQDKDYSDRQDAYANKSMRNVKRLTTMLGVSPKKIDGLQPGARKHAYHTMGYPLIGLDAWSSKDQNTLVGLLGRLPWPDAYYVSWNQEVFLGSRNLGSVSKTIFPLSADNDPLYGQMFLENLRYVKTFLTNAKRDLVIYSKALPEAMRRHTDMVKSVGEQWEDPANQGALKVTFADGVKTTIRWPFYIYGGHAVAMTMPEKLFKDVSNWMSGEQAGAQTYVRWTLGKARMHRWAGRGVTLKAVYPAARARSAMLLSSKQTPSGVTLRGSVKVQHANKVVVLKSMTVRGNRVIAKVSGRRVPVLQVPGFKTSGKGSATLTAKGAKTLNSRLGVTSFAAGMPVGKFASGRSA